MLTQTQRSKLKLLRRHFQGKTLMFILWAYGMFPETFMSQSLVININRDTVSSVGVVLRKTLPFTESSAHICHFRHALALDECRVKFIPEYVIPFPTYSGIKPSCHISPTVKEVWFEGSHSDVYVFLFTCLVSLLCILRTFTIQWWRHQDGRWLRCSKRLASLDADRGP